MLDGKVEKDSEARPKLAGHDSVERPDEVSRQPSCISLVDDAGVGKPVGNYDFTRFQGRPHNLPQMLTSIGEI
jgi:hypothetical protein